MLADTQESSCVEAFERVLSHSPTLTTGQLFLHSCLHFLGLHLQARPTAVTRQSCGAVRRDCCKNYDLQYLSSFTIAIRVSVSSGSCCFLGLGAMMAARGKRPVQMHSACWRSTPSIEKEASALTKGSTCTLSHCQLPRATDWEPIAVACMSWVLHAWVVLSLVHFHVLDS